MVLDFKDYLIDKDMSTLKVDTISTRTGSGNVTVSNALSGTVISTALDCCSNETADCE